VIEAEIEGAVNGEGAAEAHAAVHGKSIAPFEEQADHFQEVLVPADVMPYSATPPKPAITRSSRRS